MRITELTSSAKGLDPNIQIAPHEEYSSGVNWITMLVGENGSKKSLILRLIAGAALGHPRYSARGHSTVKSKVFFSGEVRATQVISLSGTVNDRFPVTAGVPIDSRPTNFDAENYLYFGPHHNGGTSPRIKMLSSLAHALLGNLSQAFSRRGALCAILESMGFAPHMNIVVIPVDRSAKSRSTSDLSEDIRETAFRDRINKIDDWLSLSPHTWGGSIREYVATLLAEPKSLVQALHFSGETWRFNFAFDQEQIWNFMEDDAHWAGRDVAFLIAIGMLRVADVSFVNKHDVDGGSARARRRQSADDLSSGQWQLLMSLLNLALSIDHDSLILVDEPENSLHPQWQQKYIEMLRSALGTATGCHAIIATHSPLVAAGVKSGCGNILSASRNPATQAIIIEDVGPVYAWRPEDVLREKFGMGSSRAPELNRVADRLLSLINSTAEHPAAPGEQEKLARRLWEMTKTLPNDDPLAPALESLIKLADTQFNID